MANEAALLAILRPRTDPDELEGFKGGEFNPDGTKFLAYTFVQLDSIYYWEYSDDHSYQIEGCW